MLNQIYIHYITTLFVLESFIISCWLLKGKKIGIGIGQFARKKSVSESATKNHDRASLVFTERVTYDLGSFNGLQGKKIQSHSLSKLLVTQFEMSVALS